MDLQNDLPPCLSDKSTFNSYDDDTLNHPLWLLPLFWRVLYRENITKSYKNIIILQKQNAYQYPNTVSVLFPLHHNITENHIDDLINRILTLQNWNILHHTNKPLTQIVEAVVYILD